MVASDVLKKRMFLQIISIVVCYAAGKLLIGGSGDFETQLQLALAMHIPTSVALFALLRDPHQGKQHEMLNAIVGMVVGTPLLFGVSVLFGAPMDQLITQTLVFASLLASCTTLPLAMQTGANPWSWLDTLVDDPRLQPQAITSVTIPALCTLIGAWVGAFPIPLDWDRPWQVWPQTCVHGAGIGYILGLIVAIITPNRKVDKTS